MKSKLFFAALLFAVVFIETKADVYDTTVKFIVYKADGSAPFEWEYDTSLTDRCASTEKFAFVVHGWQNSVSVWSKPIIDKLLEHRGGCAIYMNWGAYSESLDYPKILNTHYPELWKVLLRKFESLEADGVSPDDIFGYGHSIGARILAAAGIAFGGIIASFDLADPAGIGFYDFDKHTDTKKAAKNVQVIHTSVNFGTINPIGHQDWYMGFCGIAQSGAHPIRWLDCKIKESQNLCVMSDEDTLSHMLANEFYLSAFDNDFLVGDCAPCYKIQRSKDVPDGFKMGYLETRRNASIKVKLHSATSLEAPYNDYIPMVKDFCTKVVPKIQSTVTNAQVDLESKGGIFKIFSALIGFGVEVKEGVFNLGGAVVVGIVRLVSEGIESAILA